MAITEVMPHIDMSGGTAQQAGGDKSPVMAYGPCRLKSLCGCTYFHAEGVMYPEPTTRCETAGCRHTFEQHASASEL